MKVLHVSDFITSMKGELIKGNFNGLIDNVTIKPIKIKNRTLYFDINKYKSVNFHSLSNIYSFTVVTNSLEKFKNLGENITLIKVNNITAAYRSFIDYYRNLFNIPVIGVTGTCGKTTTKEMIKHILLSKYNNLVTTYRSKNQRPYNLGYLQQIDMSTQIAAIEMGVTWPNDLLIYCRYFKPQIGIITNIGIDHLDQCNTPENYLKAKSRLLEGMDYKGTLILNSDDQNIKKINLSIYKGKVIYFGLNEHADFAGLSLQPTDNGMKFTLKHHNQYYDASIPVFGDFNVNNALAAIAASYEAGINIEDAIEQLKSFKNIEKHFQILHGLKGCTIIDDTWSTNPTSATEALKTLKKYSGGKKTVAILGRMNLLGKRTKESHKIVGSLIAELGINTLITMDKTSKYIASGAQEKGMDKDGIYVCNSINEVMDILNSILDENTIVLVKTSMFDSYGELMNNLTLK